MVCEGRGRFTNRPYAGRGTNMDGQDVQDWVMWTFIAPVDLL